MNRRRGFTIAPGADERLVDSSFTVDPEVLEVHAESREASGWPFGRTGIEVLSSLGGGHPSVGFITVGASRANAVGWREVLLPDTGIAARVYYPAEGGGGEGDPIARAPGGWPPLLFLHGLTPREIWGSDEATWCEGETFDDDLGAIGLYRRWGSTQSALARAGYVSIAPDMTRAGDDEHLAQNAVSFLLETSEWASPVVDPARLGLVGHSLRGTPVAGVDHAAIAVLGPYDPAGLRLTGPSLVIGASSAAFAGSRDLNGDSLLAYLEAEPPKHALMLRFQAHYGYLDGLCSSVDTDDATDAEVDDQRRLTRLALRRFFDFYLHGVGSEDMHLGDVNVAYSFEPE